MTEGQQEVTFALSSIEHVVNLNHNDRLRVTGLTTGLRLMAVVPHRVTFKTYNVGKPNTYTLAIAEGRRLSARDVLLDAHGTVKVHVSGEEGVGHHYPQAPRWIEVLASSVLVWDNRSGTIRAADVPERANEVRG